MGVKSYLLVNFGGPRNLEEIPEFLSSLLLDPDVIRTRLPSFIHNKLFKRIARKRSFKVKEDYREIGGRSPIYFDTESIKDSLMKKLNGRVYTFHRYLPQTHAQTLEQIAKEEKLIVLPLFPQFSFATTGSIARFFSLHSPTKMHWIKSYATDTRFIDSFQKKIQTYLLEQNLLEEETLFLFSAHGLPQKFIDEGDPYEKECNGSFQALMKRFPKVKGRLCYQSKFGRGEWLKPYTNEASEEILNWHEGRKNIVFIPISFTTDHIETLFEIDKLYLPLIAKKGLRAYRCPALNQEPYWIDALEKIVNDSSYFPTQSLIRPN